MTGRQRIDGVPGGAAMPIEFRDTEGSTCVPAADRKHDGSIDGIE